MKIGFIIFSQVEQCNTVNDLQCEAIQDEECEDVSATMMINTMMMNTTMMNTMMMMRSLRTWWDDDEIQHDGGIIVPP